MLATGIRQDFGYVVSWVNREVDVDISNMRSMRQICNQGLCTHLLEIERMDDDTIKFRLHVVLDGFLQKANRLRTWNLDREDAA
jgi:hypothetical protein